MLEPLGGMESDFTVFLQKEDEADVAACWLKPS